MSFLDKTQVKDSFAQAATTYDAVADLQRRVGQGLLAQARAVNLTGTILDIGCGTGFLTAEIAKLPRVQVVGLDIALPMLQATRRKLSPENAGLVCADAEALPFAAQTFDHLVSNVALQWCENLPRVFADCRRVLKPDGQLLFSTFGEKTLHELKTAWANVDDYSHVNSFYAAAEIADFLQQANFQQIDLKSIACVSYYESIMALMRELKAIGAHNVNHQRRKSLTGKSKMQAMVAEYEALRGDGLIPATFEIITVTARV
jgi:malonyl-CoA O-methyltransferase